jgi:PAS domain S-box-containing protein
MDLSILLEEALAERGNAVMVIAHPRDGQDAVIWSGNPPFARIMGWEPDRVAGLRLTELRPLIERPEDWTTLIAAVSSLSTLTLDLRLRVNGKEVYLGFNLTFKLNAATSNPADDDGYGILIGRDITETRERNIRETESQRLLASVFLRISAAVAIVDGDGAVLMANPACQKLIGYGAGELAGLHVQDLTAPEFADAARDARAGQFSGAGDYVMRLDVVRKGGGRIPVTLHSTLLRDARDRRLRVATLTPDAVSADTEPENKGRVRAISLAALQAAYGNQWPRMADRAMLLAEQVIQRHLGVTDVFRRSNDGCYLIWFDGTDETRNDAVLAAATREIRQRLLAEGDDGAPEHLNAVSIGAEAIPVGPLALPAINPAATDPDDWEAEGQPLERDPDALMRYLRAGATADVEAVTGRDGIERPILLVDFAPAVRGCLYDLAPSLSREPDLGTGFDLMRLDLAVEVLAEQQPETKVLAPISWAALWDPDCRRVLDQRLARLGPKARSRIMFAVAGVPQLLGKQRWSDALQSHTGEVGLLLTHRENNLTATQEMITSGWPLALLVVDRTEGPPVVIDDYRSLFAAARRREIPVLVRTSARNDIREWRNLGAAMFVVTD